jgi:hypothetical protein
MGKAKTSSYVKKNKSEFKKDLKLQDILRHKKYRSLKVTKTSTKVRFV